MESTGILWGLILFVLSVFFIIGFIVYYILHRKKKVVIRKAYLVHFVKAGVYDLDKVSDFSEKDRLMNAGLQLDHYVVALNRGKVGLGFFSLFFAVTFLIGIVSFIFSDVTNGIVFLIISIVFLAVACYFFFQRFYYSCPKCYKVFGKAKVAYRFDTGGFWNPIKIIMFQIYNVRMYCPFCDKEGIRTVHIRSKYGKEIENALLQSIAAEKTAKEKTGSKAAGKKKGPKAGP
jgi:hypothetical protein